MLFPLSMLLIFCVGPGLSNAASPSLILPASMLPFEIQSETIQDTEITETNWQVHPKIKIIRQLVSSTNSGLKSRAFKTAERRFEYCDSAFLTLKRIARNENGEVKWYGTSGGSEDSAWHYEHYYDGKGHLSFVFVTVYAVNNSREQHRYYFDETGKLIWQNRKRLRGPGYFAPQDIERLVNVDPARAFANDEGLQGVKLQT